MDSAREYEMQEYYSIGVLRWRKDSYKYLGHFPGEILKEALVSSESWDKQANKQITHIDAYKWWW